MLIFFSAFTGGCFFLLSFIVAINSKRVNKIANRLLAIFLLSIGLLVIDDALIYAQFYTKFPIFIGLISIPVFGLAPILYLMVDYFVTPAKTFKRMDLWHFLLLFLMTILTILYMFMPTTVKLKDLESPINKNNIWDFILILIPIVLYWGFSYKKLLLHEKNVRLFSSSIESIDLAWLRYFLGGLAFMILALLSDFIITIPARTYITTLIYLLSAFYLSYFALQQGEIFSAKPEETIDIKTIIDENNQADVIRKQVLTEAQLTILKATLADFMVTQKPYLDSTLSLPKLAKKVQLNTHELSYLINVGFNDNFFGFINFYRVEESKRLLTSPQYPPLSMVSIAFEAGFNSKTAFNTAFKKMVGVSPSAFQKLNIR
jgi:AraC-like DNA-binding protein